MDSSNQDDGPMTIEDILAAAARMAERGELVARPELDEETGEWGFGYYLPEDAPSIH